MKTKVTPEEVMKLVLTIEREGFAYTDNALRKLAKILANPYIEIDEGSYFLCKERVEFLMNKKKIKNEIDFAKPFRPEPDEKSRISEGDIEIGRTLEGNLPVRLKLPELLRHLAVVGMTGFGKTAFLIRLISQLIECGISVVIFDKKGRQFRGLQAMFPDKVLIFTVGKDAFLNFNAWPSGVNKEGYLSRISDIRSRVFERHDSIAVYNHNINNLFMLADENRHKFPSEFEVSEGFKTMRMPTGVSVNPSLKWSQQVISSGILESPLGASLKCSKGIMPGELARKNISIIIETQNLSNLHELYLQTLFSNQSYSDLQTDALSYPDILRQVFIIDESQHIFGKFRRCEPIHEFHGFVRYSGISIGQGTTTPSALGDSTKSNTFAYLSFHLFNEDDIATVKRSMFLNFEQAVSLSHIPTFICCAKLGDRYTSPFLMRTVLPRLPQITDEQVEENNKRILQTLSPIVPRKPWSFGNKNETKSVLDEETIVLQDIAKRPFIGVAERCKTISLLPGEKTISLDSGMIILDKLEQHGWVEFLELQMSRKGRMTKFYLLTEAGRTKAAFPEGLDLGRGGRSKEHRFIQELIAHHLRENHYTAIVEGDMSGKKVDVKVVDVLNNLTIAIEIPLSTENLEYDQAVKDLAADFDRVIVACPDRVTLNRVEKSFKEHPEVKDPRIQIHPIWRVLESVNNKRFDVLFSW